MNMLQAIDERDAVEDRWRKLASDGNHWMVTEVWPRDMSIGGMSSRFRAIIAPYNAVHTIKLAIGDGAPEISIDPSDAAVGFGASEFESRKNALRAYDGHG